MIIDDLGRVAIPLNVRRALNINSGDVMEFSVDMVTHNIIMTPHPSEDIVERVTDAIEHAIEEYTRQNNVSDDNKMRLTEHIADIKKILIAPMSEREDI